jgi:arylsulfatase A
MSRLRNQTALTKAALCAAVFAAGVAALPAVQAQGVAASAPAPQRAARADKRPNIILILADDVGVEAFNAYGGEYYTPNLDRMAREGMRFDNAHATPLCSPSRTRLMTGLENHRNYEAFGYLAPGQRTFGNMLKEAGYVTGMVGKWQLSGNGYDGRVGITPEQAGFQESSLWQLKALDAKGSRYWGPTRVTAGRTKIDEEGFGPDRDQAFALDFIERHKNAPFFLYYSMVLVHDPFVPTPASMTAEGSKNRFAGMMSYMDGQVGALLDKLKALGLDEDTIVLFTADNGTNRQITSIRNGVAVQGGKASPTLNGTHVPMIVRAPGRAPAGATSPALVDFLDMMPTFAQIAGVELEPGSTDGVSQLDVMTGKSRSARDTIFMHYDPRWIAKPTRFAFDAGYKLYDDGRFVALDPATGVETEMVPAKMSAAARQRKAALERVMSAVPKVPFSKERFPMCVGRPSRDPKLPAIEAGCGSLTGNMAD